MYCQEIPEVQESWRTKMSRENLKDQAGFELRKYLASPRNWNT